MGALPVPERLGGGEIQQVREMQVGGLLLKVCSVCTCVCVCVCVCVEWSVSEEGRCSKCASCDVVGLPLAVCSVCVCYVARKI